MTIIAGTTTGGTNHALMIFSFETIKKPGAEPGFYREFLCSLLLLLLTGWLFGALLRIALRLLLGSSRRGSRSLSLFG
jgi:hypothetical protein